MTEWLKFPSFRSLFGFGTTSICLVENAFISMRNCFQNVISTVAPIPDSIYGPRYRCALTLEDGTHLPCAVLQSESKLIELAKHRIKQEMSGKGIIGGPDPYGQILSSFVAAGNRVNDYDVVSASSSIYAPPLALLHQIHGETTMGWTGWVFEMKDGKLFQYGTSFSMEFFHLPEGYSFEDVVKVHNHSFLSKDGALLSLQRGGILPPDYSHYNLFRERVFFTCYINDISHVASEAASGDASTIDQIFVGEKKPWWKIW